MVGHATSVARLVIQVSSVLTVVPKRVELLPMLLGHVQSAARLAILAISVTIVVPRR